MNITTAFILICIVGGLLLILSIFLTPGVPTKATYLNRGTRTFLVLLRLVIGWHFLVEGLEKVQDPNWTAQPYLHAAVGPLRPYFSGIADDSFLSQFDLGEQGKQDLSLLVAEQLGRAGLAAAPPPTPASAAAIPGRTVKLPGELDRRWQRYFDTFVEEFGLDEQQQQLARIKLDQAKARTLLWLATPQFVEKPSPYLPRPLKATAAERVAYYRQVLESVEQAVAEDVAAFGEKANARVQARWQEANKVYASLKRDLDEQTEEMKKDLRAVLDSEQRNLRLPEAPPPEMSFNALRLADRLIPWALTLVGVCLLVGLFTRLCCVLGALLLLSFFLAMPPIPGWWDNPRAEGHYLYLNKNTIEMLALLVLATTHSGRWLGVDALVHVLRRAVFPGRRSAPADDSRVPK